MMQDIKDRADIKQLVDTFYTKVRADETIGYLFNDVAKVNWEQHLPRMYDFWENILFQTGGFKGNPMVAHVQLHQKSPLSAAHFARWQELFLATVDELFKGDMAELIKQRARSIATMMLIKVSPSNDPKSII
ncbi:hemoglobin-like protein [Niastella vici]|uniref:Hemoglobin-like protein n=1 Tax=Niastella vici TaxID=1703345 RepID=A0A1V9G185_9BACT|nr:group III truncated hemoglobin [Niastella vici]OQP64327.1 hemoglobin-like protein [Niastella vici]